MFVRRLLTGLLTLALTHFGVLAIAPAHAHEDAGHGVREIVLSHDAHEPAAHDHGGVDDDGHDTVAVDAADAQPQFGPMESGAGGAGHGEHAHVHACPQFAPISGQAVLAAPVMQLKLTWPVRTAPAVPYLSSPPLRPPRQLL